MQLVEQKKLVLNDADQVGSICPELQNIRIPGGVDESSGKAKFVEKKTKITLRMLLIYNVAQRGKRHRERLD